MTGEFMSVPLIACVFGFSGLGEEGGSSSRCFLLLAFGILTKGVAASCVGVTLVTIGIVRNVVIASPKLAFWEKVPIYAEFFRGKYSFVVGLETQISNGTTTNYLF